MREIAVSSNATFHLVIGRFQAPSDDKLFWDRLLRCVTPSCPDRNSAEAMIAAFKEDFAAHTKNINIDHIEKLLVSKRHRDQ